MLIGIVVLRYYNAGNPNNNQNTTNTVDISNENDIIAAMQQKRLVYTRHAECRMDCRYISESEVKAALRNGRINERKSKPNDQPCPTYAVEDNTADGQTVRIVFADCDKVVKVVTAIDLKGEYDCYCK